MTNPPDGRPAPARVPMDQLDACHDMKPWTNEMARSWWNEQGASVLAYVAGACRPATLSPPRRVIA
jgi:hypothetical protein